MNKYKVTILILVIITVIVASCFTCQIVELKKTDRILKNKIEFLFKAYSGKDYQGRDFGEDFWQEGEENIEEQCHDKI